VGSCHFGAAWTLCRHSNEILVVAELGKVPLVALVQPGGCTLTVIRSAQALGTHAAAHHHRHLQAGSWKQQRTKEGIHCAHEHLIPGSRAPP